MRKRETLHIAGMLRAQKRGHLSFHTPGHKRAGADITELSYADNLLSPRGVIARAEEDVARILGARRTFFTTDGSTSGVYAMLGALKERGVRSLAAPVFSHRSVTIGCELLSLRLVPVPCAVKDGVPLQPEEGAIARAADEAEALLLTSPDYYGNFPPLAAARAICSARGIPLLVDGAHGAHLHGTALHASAFADLFVDGAHKSLPALTQGAAVSAKGEEWAEALCESVVRFRTTSPSYPILASIEAAFKYPRNEKIERAAQAFKAAHAAYPNADWSKILIPFGEHCDAAQAYLESHGVYPEFNDGTYLMFYLSPCTRMRDLARLARLIARLPRGAASGEEPAAAGGEGKGAEWIALEKSEGRICARDCGRFPPCLPLIRRGERVTAKKIGLLGRAASVYGLRDGRILVYTE